MPAILRTHRCPALEGHERKLFLILAGIFTLGGITSTLISVHLITLLQSRGVALAAAVSFGALIGPSQVGARVVEMMFGKHYHPGWTLTAATALIATGVCLLAAGFPIVALALIAYGAGNGIWSIARGTLPLRLFGPDHYAPLMDASTMPSEIAQSPRSDDRRSGDCAKRSRCDVHPALRTDAAHYVALAVFLLTQREANARIEVSTERKPVMSAM